MVTRLEPFLVFVVFKHREISHPQNRVRFRIDQVQQTRAFVSHFNPSRVYDFRFSRRRKEVNSLEWRWISRLFAPRDFPSLRLNLSRLPTSFRPARLDKEYSVCTSEFTASSKISPFGFNFALDIFFLPLRNRRRLRLSRSVSGSSNVDLNGGNSVSFNTSFNVVISNPNRKSGLSLPYFSIASA